MTYEFIEKHEWKSISIFFLSCAAANFRKIYTSNKATPHDISTIRSSISKFHRQSIIRLLLFVHMSVPSPTVRRRCKWLRRRELILANCHIIIIHNLVRSFEDGVTTTKQPAIIIFHTREIVRIIIWYIDTIRAYNTIFSYNVGIYTS